MAGYACRRARFEQSRPAGRGGGKVLAPDELGEERPPRRSLARVTGRQDERQGEEEPRRDPSEEVATASRRAAASIQLSATRTIRGGLGERPWTRIRTASRFV